MENRDSECLKLCRACLSTEYRLKIMSKNDKELLNYLILKTDLPEGAGMGWLCYRCAHTIRKLSTFRDICTRADNKLRNLFQKKESQKDNSQHYKQEIYEALYCQLTYSNTLCINVLPALHNGSSTSHAEVISFNRTDLDSHKNHSDDMRFVFRDIKQEEDDTNACFLDGHEDTSGYIDEGCVESELKHDSSDEKQINLKVFHDYEESKSSVPVVNKERKGKKTKFKELGKKNCCHLRNSDEMKGTGDTKEFDRNNITEDCTTSLKSIEKSHIKGLHKKCIENVRVITKTLNELENSNVTDCEKVTKQKSKRNDITCDICQKVFKHQSALKRHHIVHSSDRPFPCSQCDKRFLRSIDLKKHTLVHNGLKSYMCEVCGQSFSLLGNLNSHKVVHSKEKKFSCSTCGKLFGHSSEVQRHARVHSGLKPYKCKVCDRAFAISGNLRNHERTHSGLRPFLCLICGKSYTESGYLKKHQRIHSGERPYGCTVCNRSFSTSCALKTHFMIHTGLRPYSCDQCSYRSTKSNHVKRHKQVHNKAKKNQDR